MIDSLTQKVSIMFDADSTKVGRFSAIPVTSA